MAVVTGNDYDHIDIVNGNTQTRHMIKDASARADISDLKSAIDHDVFSYRGQIDTTVTSLSTLTDAGFYYIPKARVANLVDKPSGATNENTLLYVTKFTNQQMIQWYVVRGNSKAYTRSILAGTVGSWVDFQPPLDYEAIIYTGSQALTDTQKAQVIANIGAVSFSAAFQDRGEVALSVTALSTLKSVGTYVVPTTRYANLTDLPEELIANKGQSILIVYSNGEETYNQILIAKNYGLQWMRSISGSTVGNWTEQGISKPLSRFSAGDANNLVNDGIYNWGSSDSVSHVPFDAGTMIFISRDASTKYELAIGYASGQISVRVCKAGTWTAWSGIAKVADLPVHTELPSTIVALSAAITDGSYLVPTSVYSRLTDLPSDITTQYGASILLNYTTGVNTLWQMLISKNYGLTWIRSISGTTVGSWTEQNISRPLARFSSGNANSLLYDGIYTWGSSDTVTNVPFQSGMIQFIRRDANTQFEYAIDYSTAKMASRVCKFGTWTDWNYMASISDIPSFSGALKPVFKYEAGSFDDGKAIGRLMIYTPMGDHYIGYYLNHYTQSNAGPCDCWCVFAAYAINATDYSIIKRLTAGGEWECAIRLDGWDNFAGGVTHGCEVMTGWHVLVDGIEITNDLSDYTSPTEFTEIRLVRQSNMLNRDNQSETVAVHGCEYVFNGSTELKINQSLEWQGAYELGNCYLAMFTPSKNYTDHVYTDLDFGALSIPSNAYQIDKNNVKKAVIYGETGMMASFEIERYPERLTGGDKWRLTDNNSSDSSTNNYNKMYYFVTSGSAQSIANELWQSTTIYNIKA